MTMAKIDRKCKRPDNGYESPVTVYYEDMSTQIRDSADGQIMAEIRMHVDVDKEELIKALNYDRNQYSKGYQMGVFDAYTDIEDPWIPVTERLPEKSEYGQVLVTFIPPAGTLWMKVIIANYSDLMGIAKPCFWIGEVGKRNFENITERVTAWIPLPEPYGRKYEF